MKIINNAPPNAETYINIPAEQVLAITTSPDPVEWNPLTYLEHINSGVGTILSKLWYDAGYIKAEQCINALGSKMYKIYITPEQYRDLYLIIGTKPKSGRVKVILVDETGNISTSTKIVSDEGPNEI